MGRIRVNDPIRPLALRSVLSPTALGRLTFEDIFVPGLLGT
jgi:hypothetical protein